MHLFQLCTVLPTLVLFLQIKQPHALPSELGVKLKDALDKPENAAMFNEINNSLESDYIDSVVNLSFFDDFKKNTPSVLATTTETVSTTSETPTAEINSSDEDKEHQSSDGILKRGLISFLGTLMRIRNFFHVDN